MGLQAAAGEGERFGVEGYAAWKAEPERAESAEVDFGLWWTDRGNYPRYRVSWLRATGELYAAEQSVPKSDRYEVFGVFRTREDVEEVMGDWTESNRKLDWIRARV